MKEKKATKQVCCMVCEKLLLEARKLSKSTGIPVSRLVENGLRKELNSSLYLYKGLQ